MAHFDTQVWPTCEGLLMLTGSIGDQEFGIDRLSFDEL